MDEEFLKETLRLAKKGIGWTNPNPMVGAILVKNGVIIGRGYHKKYGSAHAEAEALKSCNNPKGATMYVNLEPCNHYGQTPPCAEAIIASGVRKVVCSNLDPNPKTRGKGAAKLKKSGIEVVVGPLSRQAGKLNETFFTFYEKGRPFVALKFAASLDGKIATKTGDSKWITNEKAREFAGRLRGQYQAVLVGINTVLKDDPNLGAKIKGLKDPIRIILDPNLKIAEDAQVLRDTNVVLGTTQKADQKKLADFKTKFRVLVFEGKIMVAKLLERLKEKGIISILVEGGGNTLGQFVDSGLVDKVYAFQAPVLIGGEKAIGAVGGKGAERVTDALHLKNVSFKRFGDNLLTAGYPV